MGPRLGAEEAERKNAPPRRRRAKLPKSPLRIADPDSADQDGWWPRFAELSSDLIPRCA
ncbi:MAG: hypothetical protein RLZZ399_677 [Verrucomicrobiota bacterium]|jgi:hypothetical protein